MTRVVVGVDPGSATGAAVLLFEGPRQSVVWTKEIRDPGGLEVRNMLREASSRGAARAGVRDISCVLAVEDQWIPRPGGDPKKLAAQSRAALTLAARRGAWVAIAECLGYRVVELHPSTWRKTQIGKARASRDHAKRLAVTVATSIWPVLRNPSHDVAEAALMARHAGVELAMEDL